MVERKKQKPVSEATHSESASVGATLRAARLARGMEIDSVSQSIHIRPTQLKAIEDNDIESLPGMTYAVGFVRSYANFLGLNGAEIVHRFKAEQGHNQPSKLTFPEPIAESRVPDPMMVGVGAFMAVVILVLWTVYSNAHNGSKTADQIPPTPVVTGVTETPPVPPVAAATAAATPPSVPLAAAPVVTPVPETKLAVAPAPAAADIKPEQSLAPPVAAIDQVKKVETSAAAEDKEDTVAAEDDTEAVDKPAKKKNDHDSVIKIKPGKSRIALKATQASWVQVTDAQQNVIYRKVLRPGEQYSVPDQPGQRSEMGHHPEDQVGLRYQQRHPQVGDRRRGP